MKRKYRILKETYNNGSVEYSIQYTIGVLGIFNCWVKIGVNKVKESIMLQDHYFYDLSDVNYKFANYEEAKEAVRWLSFDKSCSLGVDNNKLIYLFDVSVQDDTAKIETFGAKNLKTAIKLFDKYSKVERIKVLKKEILYVE